jgi:Flp pilus assembly protein CpaB
MALRTLKGVVVRARRGVIKGEQITRSNVQEEGAELGLSWALSATETAASVLLPPERAAGGHLEPGDRVDVIGVFDHQPGWDEASAVVLDTGVKILAVNDRVINSPSPQGGENMKREVSNEPILVTLSVPLHGAARMALAQEKGRVFLMLTSPLETGVHSAAAVALRSLKR